MKILLSSFLVSCLMVPCFAGAVANEEVYYPPDMISKEPAPKVITVTKVVEKVVEKPAPKPEPSKGFAIGIHDGIPTLVYNAKIWDLEAGYTSLNANAKAILKAGLGLGSDNEDYTVIKTGLTLVQDNGTRLGWYAGIEQYIEKSISVTGDVYAVISGDNITDILIGILGARIYI